MDAVQRDLASMSRPARIGLVVEQTFTKLSASDVIVDERSVFAEHVLIGLSE